MNINNGEEILALLNRLLEGLQQAGGATPNGSHYTFVYVAPDRKSTRLNSSHQIMKS